jgi:hypothetical protein
VKSDLILWSIAKRCVSKDEATERQNAKAGTVVAVPAPPDASVSKALLAVGPGVPARRAVVERAAGAGRAAVETRAATLRHPDDFVRRGFAGRVHRHRLGGGGHQAEANGKRGCNKHFILSSFLSICFSICRDAAVF